MSMPTNAGPGDHRRATRRSTRSASSPASQPVAADERLRNLPAEAIYNWEPGAQFGIYRPDSFWFENGAE
jgi:hypothetical protein